MVNGKPTLTLGGSTSPAPTTARQSGRFNRVMDSFSSYLPKDGASAPATSAPTLERAAQVMRNAQVPASEAGQTFIPKAPQAAAARDGARMHLGYFPTDYVSTGARDFAKTDARAAQAPAGGQSLAQARAAARPGAESMMSAHAPTMGSQPLRVPGKTSPRVSGRPITGRGEIGMVDTRKISGGRSTLADKGALNYASPTANAARGQAMAAAHQPASRPAQPDLYSQIASRYGSDYSGQSFLTHGFSGKNAEMALKNMGYDLQEARNIQTVARKLEPDPYALKNMDYVPPGTTFGSTRPVAFASGEDGARTAVLTNSHRRKNEAAAPAGKSLVNTFYNRAEQGLGTLAAKFESGEEGIAAIGYDRTGGTSYGKYQIASKPGTMNSFISYLREKAPDLAQRLASTGPANTGGRTGKMPAEWRKIAAEDPGRFENLQSDFIRTSHFEPAMQAIAVATGVAFETLPTALQEVLFSTAVQHGPAGATRIVSQALNRVDARQLQDGNTKNASTRKTGEQLITQIYNLRAGQFVSSTSRVQSAVRSRLRQEMREALDMLA